MHYEGQNNIHKILNNGLILRSSTPADLDQLIEFNQQIHYFVPDHTNTISSMTRDLMSGHLSTFQPQDFLLVVEKNSNKIVSSMALISQIWQYENILIKVGRPELVGTDPAFRGKGLIRELFNVAHEISKKRGHLIQAITGIPFFYRQFGYELGVPLGGGWAGYPPVNNNGKDEILRNNEFTIRQAEVTDLRWIQECYQSGCSRYLLSASRDLNTWCYEILDKSNTNIHKVDVNAIFSTENQPVGFFICPKRFTTSKEITIIWYDLLPGIPWNAVTVMLFHWLWNKSEKDYHRINLMLGEDHPAYHVGDPFLSEKIEPGAWYIRVADLVSFLLCIVPVLEKRINQSAWSAFSGNLRISNYRESFYILFDRGKIGSIQPYKLSNWDDADAAFPNLCFLQLLFGFRSLYDLQYAYPDCWIKPEFTGLIQTLFQKKPSNVWGIA